MILLLTHSQDYYVPDLLKESLEKKGYKSSRINTDDFPLKFSLSVSIEKDKEEIVISTEEGELPLSEIKGGWLRKHWDPNIRADIDPLYKDGCFRESKEVLEIFLHELKNIQMIDCLEDTNRASNKFFQLQKAKQAGIEIPKTLITSDPKALKKFYSVSKTEIVAKMLTPLSTSMHGTDFFIYTSKITEEHLEDAELLKDCPMCFQEYIEKQYELRIIYIDGRFFTGKIDASNSKAGKVDWRKAKPGEVFWEEYELPEEVKKRLNNFMKSINLRYGAIDMIRSTDERYVFLEVNAHGEWGMLQRDLNYPISDGIADALIRTIKR